MGKRPDQIHKDKLSTDYKQRTDDKRNLEESRADSKIPEAGLNPALEDLQAKRAQQQDGEQ
jgi:hypothetical protein